MNIVDFLNEYKYKNNLNLNLIRVQFFMRKNTIEIYLYLANAISLSQTDLKLIKNQFETELSLTLNKDTVNTNIVAHIFNRDSLGKYFVKELSKEETAFHNLNKDSFSWSKDKLTISLDNDLLVKKLNDSRIFAIYKGLLSIDNHMVDVVTKSDSELLDLLAEHERMRESERQNEIKIALEKSQNRKKQSKKITNKDIFSYGFKRKEDPPLKEIFELLEDNQLIRLEGTIFEIDIREINKGAFVRFDLDDGNYAVRCKKYVPKKDLDYFKNGLHNGLNLKLFGVYKFDEFDKAKIIDVSYMEEIEIENSNDHAKDKRIEFNIHSKYTNLEGLVDIDELVSTLKRWGHTSFGITDSYNVQAYPEIYPKAKKAGIKVNLGSEFKMLDNSMTIVNNPGQSQDLNSRPIVVFDIETTGLSRFNDNITEIGAVKIQDHKIIDSYQQLVNPQMLISEFITNLTGISNEMVSDQPTIDKVLPEFLEFAGDAILAAHNAEFDIGFIKSKADELSLDFNPIFLDTLWLARALRPDLKNHRLNTLAKNYQIRLDNHHRASDDANATAEIMLELLNKAYEQGYDLQSINTIKSSFEASRYPSYHHLIYVQNKIGLKNMYINVSKASLDYLWQSPGLSWEAFESNRQGLLISTGSHKTKLFELIANNYPKELIKNEANYFDFFTVEPVGFYPYLVKEGLIKDEDHFISILNQIIELADELEKPVIAIGNVYYLEENDYKYQNILRNYPRKRNIISKGYFYLRNTQEMLKEFDFLDADKAFDIVVRNTQLLDEMIEEISPIASGTYPPRMENAKQRLREDSYEKAKSIYGEDLPDIVEKRLERELNSIISNGYATLYIIAKELVKKSNDDGYLVGSRGSVGSSFAATMAEITEVNPLVPHYICPKCKHSEFITDQSYGTGVDLPEKKCPNCNVIMDRDGFDIPFEVFLGFEGDKEPDIDLNFAGVYQANIHKHTETMFGDRKVFRAGTLGTIAEKTAYGMARKFQEFYPNDDSVRYDAANMDKIKRKLVGVKRTTGQHAGGLIVVPDDKDIEDFTPIQYPADQKSSGIITTHFDYHAIEENLLKLDLLGHNAPSIIRMLSDDTGTDALSIDLSDADTMSLFSSNQIFGIDVDYTNKDTGSLGIPEFGTTFVRQMLRDTKPTSFEELVRISGLSHGTDVWLNNAQTLINDGVTVLKDAICTRDDIMNYLIGMGMESKHAFNIMEQVRKGRGLNDNDISAMSSAKVPQWYIDSCNKIKYMFPRAHAVAYVMMSFRIAYYKVHYPAYFYASYFTNKIADYQHNIISRDLDYITMYIKELKKSPEFTVDDKFYCIEVAEEMKARGIVMLGPDLYESEAEKFIVLETGEILPPLMAVENVSNQIALRIDEARKDGNFLSIQDFSQRSRVNKTALASLEAAGLFEGMSNENQMDFFSI